MFSTKERLKQRTGRNKVDRFAYLKQLSEEYKTTNSLEAKRQVLANLANFAYDPINYEFIRKLSIIDLFLGELESTDESIVEFSIAGICNLCLDFQNKDHIISTEGALPSIKYCLNSTNEETVINAITSLMYLVTPTSKASIISKDTVETLLAFSHNPNPRIKNLAKVFLEDFCTPAQVKEGEIGFKEFLASIKIPT